MPEKETKIRRKTQQEASAQEKLQEKEQMPQSSEETERLQEPSISEDIERDSTKTRALVGAAKAIEEGVEFVGEKAPEVASMVLHKVKKGVSVAYGTSSILVRDAYHAASDYAHKYRHRIEVQKLKAQREATSSRLGSVVYTRIIIDGEPPEKAFVDQEITSLLEQIQDLDNEVVKLGKELEDN